MKMRVIREGSLSELLAAATTGCVIELGVWPVSEMVSDVNPVGSLTLIHGDKSGTFHLLGHDGFVRIYQENFGKSAANFRVGGFGIFLNHHKDTGSEMVVDRTSRFSLKDGSRESFGVILRDNFEVGDTCVVDRENGEFRRITSADPGGIVSLGTHKCDENFCVLGDTPIIFEGSSPYRLTPDGRKESISRSFSYDDCCVTKDGLVVREGDEFVLCDERGFVKRSLGSHKFDEENDEWGYGSFGLVISRWTSSQEKCEFFHVRPDNSEVSLGKHDCSFWIESEHGLLIAPPGGDNDDDEKFDWDEFNSELMLLVIKE